MPVYDILKGKRENHDTKTIFGNAQAHFAENSGSAKIRNGQFLAKWGEMGNFWSKGGEMGNFWAKWA